MSTPSGTSKHGKRDASHVSFSPEQNRLYARGWPHLRTLVDKHKLDKKPDDAVRKLFDEPDPTFGVEWPREVAHRFVRVLAESKGTPGWEPAFAKPGPITEVEARALIDRLLHPAISRPQLQAIDFLLLVEAMVGTEVVTDAILRRFERYAPKDWQHDNLRNAFFTALVAPVALPAAYYLGFFLLRVPDSTRKKYRARVEALLKAAPADRPLHVAFDLVLNGSEAVRRHRVKALCACHHVEDDPMLVRQLSQHDEHVFSLSPRFVHLGGPDVLDHFAERAKALPRWATVRFTEEFGTIKHPKIIPIMLTLSGKKTAKDAPLSWFFAHSDFARPFLDEIAIRKSPQGEAARAMIEALDAPKPAAPAKKGAAPAAKAKAAEKPAPAPKAKTSAAKPAPSKKPERPAKGAAHGKQDKKESRATTSIDKRPAGRAAALSAKKQPKKKKK